VVANAWQHRADVSTSSAVFFGLIGSMLGYPLLDPLAGVLVAGVIVRQVLKTLVHHGVSYFDFRLSK
jgi:divalent metal cation (Fe/Co/Zn/Cd) transporter